MTYIGAFPGTRSKNIHLRSNFTFISLLNVPGTYFFSHFFYSLLFNPIFTSFVAGHTTPL